MCLAKKLFESRTVCSNSPPHPHNGWLRRNSSRMQLCNMACSNSRGTSPGLELKRNSSSPNSNWNFRQCRPHPHPPLLRATPPSCLPLAPSAQGRWCHPLPAETRPRSARRRSGGGEAMVRAFVPAPVAPQAQPPPPDLLPRPSSSPCNTARRLR